MIDCAEAAPGKLLDHISVNTLLTKDQIPVQGRDMQISVYFYPPERLANRRTIHKCAQ